MNRILAATVLSSVFALPAFAADDKCTCRAMGRNFEVGQTVCLKMPSGQTKLAKCGMVLNNTAWEFTDTPCTTSRLFTPVTLAALWTD